MLNVNDGIQLQWTYTDIIIKGIGTETVVIIEQLLKEMCIGYT
jgi:hypothetical protein